MKSILFSLAAAGLVAAQNFTGQPDCAIDCLREAIPKVGCALDDTGCQCTGATQDALTGIAGPCLLANCSPQDLLKARGAASEACAAFASASPSGTTGSGLTIQTSTPSGSATRSRSVTRTNSDSAASTDSVASTDSTDSTESGTETVTETTTATDDSSSSTTDDATTTDSTETETETETTSTTESGGATSTSADGAAGAGPTIGAIAAILAAAIAL